MPYLKGIIRLSLVMAFVALAALVTSHFALQDLYRRDSEPLADWIVVRVTLSICVVFIAVSAIAFSRVLQQLRKRLR
jgi:heme/copper-type cytochrome/quinol oxidase subunit 3